MEPNLENKVDIEHFKLDEENISTDSENSFSSKDELCDDILNYSHEDAYDSFDEYNEACNKFNNLNEQDKIICIELMNNNKIYINYYDNWTIRDVSKIFHLLSFSLLH